MNLLDPRRGDAGGGGVKQIVWIAACGSFLAASVTKDAVAQDGDLAVILKGNLTSSVEIYPNPKSSDPGLRAQYYSLDNVIGAGVEVRYRIPESLVAIGLSSDYLHAVQSRSVPMASRQEVPVEDGYTVVPVEFSAYFIIPASGPTLGLFMGGGVGAYFGRREYSFAGVSAPVVSTAPGFGIHVLAGVSYRVMEQFSVVGEMKFRDLQFQSTNAFQVDQISAGGAVFNVGRRPFESRVQTDGVVFQIGVAFHI